MTAKVPLKVHLRLRFQNPGKPRTAGLCGRAAGACDCGPLSVLKSNGLRHPKNLPVKFGFRPKPFPQISPKSYRHNAVPNRFSSRFSTSRTNGPRSLSRVKAGTHSAFGEGSHTAAYTAKQGRFRWGWYHYSRSVPHVHQHPRAGYQNGKFCRFWGLAGCAPKERRKPSGQRCAYARRCPEASRPRWAA